jgi:hypothetical protein
MVTKFIIRLKSCADCITVLLREINGHTEQTRTTFEGLGFES